MRKSREVGVTWVCAAFIVHHWLFVPGFRAGIGSRKLEFVDRLGDPKSVFEKLRAIIRNLPPDLLPKGWEPRRHDNYCKLINPENEATVTGEGGDDIGRGDRVGIYFVDESASLEHPELVAAALSATTRVRIDVSTPKGLGWFYERCKSLPPEQVFSFGWRDDPRKDEAWYEAEKKRIGTPWIVAQEIDMDDNASAEGREWPPDFFDGIFFPVEAPWPPSGTRCRVMALDPSKGSQDESGDDSAWISLAVDQELTLWVDADLDAFRPIEPLSFSGGRSVVTDGIAIARQFHPEGVLVEVNGGQHLVAMALWRHATQQSLTLPIYTVNHTVSSGSKQQRIRQLGQYLAQRRLRVRDTPGGRRLVEQMQAFPLKTAKDDGPDALSMAETMADWLIYHVDRGGDAIQLLRT